jgi:hypothetical protein
VHLRHDRLQHRRARWHLDDGDPRALLLAIYDWLSWLQETLVRSLP